MESKTVSVRKWPSNKQDEIVVIAIDSVFTTSIVWHSSGVSGACPPKRNTFLLLFYVPAVLYGSSSRDERKWHVDFQVVTLVTIYQDPCIRSL